MVYLRCFSGPLCMCESQGCPLPLGAAFGPTPSMGALEPAQLVVYIQSLLTVAFLSSLRLRGGVPQVKVVHKLDSGARFACSALTTCVTLGKLLYLSASVSISAKQGLIVITISHDCGEERISSDR